MGFICAHQKLSLFNAGHQFGFGFGNGFDHQGILECSGFLRSWYPYLAARQGMGES